MSKKSNFKILFGLPVFVLLAVTILVLISPSYDDIARRQRERALCCPQLVPVYDLHTSSQTQVEGMIESSGKRWVVAKDGQLPAASPDSQEITYQDVPSGHIAAAMCTGDTHEFSSDELDGSWNAWRPDGSGLLFQDQETFYALPFSGSQETFVEKSQSTALRPAGGYGAVLTATGNLSMYPLKDWLIAGDAREIKPLIKAGFITWWSPGHMPVAVALR